MTYQSIPTYSFGEVKRIFKPNIKKYQWRFILQNYGGRCTLNHYFFVEFGRDMARLLHSPQEIPDAESGLTKQPLHAWDF